MALSAQALVWSATSPLGRFALALLRRVADLLETDSVVVQCVEVQLDANAGQRTAADHHLANALNLRELLGQDRTGRVIDLAAAQGVGGQRQDQNRRVGRIDLFVGRIARQIGGQLAARRVDGGLHVARGGIDVAVQIELQDDAGGAKRAGRRQFGQPRDTPELALQRSRHGRRHRLGAGAGQACADLDGWEIDLRQRRDRQHPECRRSRQRDRHGQQRGRDGPAYEGLGKAHEAREVAGSR